MAKISRIGHDHQGPFWLVVVFGLGYQAVTRGENKLPHGQYNLDPNIFTDSGHPIKLLEVPPNPLTPLMGG